MSALPKLLPTIEPQATHHPVNRQPINWHTYATQYKALGITTLPVGGEHGKKPLYEKNAGWLENYQTTEDTENIFNQAQNPTGIAAVLGKVSQNLLALDFDFPHPASLPIAQQMQSAIIAHYRHEQGVVISPSALPITKAQGTVLWVRVDTLPSQNLFFGVERFKFSKPTTPGYKPDGKPKPIQIELRTNGIQVLPPSLYLGGLPTPTGKPTKYRAHNTLTGEIEQPIAQIELSVLWAILGDYIELSTEDITPPPPSKPLEIIDPTPKTNPLTGTWEISEQDRAIVFGVFDAKGTPNTTGFISCRCPWHGDGTDKKRSAGIHQETLLINCHACAEIHPTGKVLAYAGVRAKFTSSTKLPMQAMAQFNRWFRGGHTRLIYLIYLHYQGGEKVTQSDIFDILKKHHTTEDGKPIVNKMAISRLLALTIDSVAKITTRASDSIKRERADFINRLGDFGAAVFPSEQVENSGNPNSNKIYTIPTIATLNYLLGVDGRMFYRDASTEDIATNQAFSEWLILGGVGEQEKALSVPTLAKHSGFSRKTVERYKKRAIAQQRIVARENIRITKITTHKQVERVLEENAIAYGYITTAKDGTGEKHPATKFKGRQLLGEHGAVYLIKRGGDFLQRLPSGRVSK